MSVGAGFPKNKKLMYRIYRVFLNYLSKDESYIFGCIHTSREYLISFPNFVFFAENIWNSVTIGMMMMMIMMICSSTPIPRLKFS